MNRAQVQTLLILTGAAFLALQACNQDMGSDELTARSEAALMTGEPELGEPAEPVLEEPDLISPPPARTPWQVHDGLEVTAKEPLGLVPFTCSPMRHGALCEYQDATIPPQAHPDWRTARNPRTINFSVYPSRVCQAPVTCMAYGDFTYFQTLVSVPLRTRVLGVTIDFIGVDDGSQVTVFNSLFPFGVVVPGSHVFYGYKGTADLTGYIRPGEMNRVVVTHVDDCCVESTLQSAVMYFNGLVLEPACEVKTTCADGEPCLLNVCMPDGSQEP